MARWDQALVEEIRGITANPTGVPENIELSANEETD
jgi:hypothetical protein